MPLLCLLSLISSNLRAARESCLTIHLIGKHPTADLVQLIVAKLDCRGCEFFVDSCREFQRRHSFQIAHGLPLAMLPLNCDRSQRAALGRSHQHVWDIHFIERKSCDRHHVLRDYSQSCGTPSEKPKAYLGPITGICSCFDFCSKKPARSRNTGLPKLCDDEVAWGWPRAHVVQLIQPPGSELLLSEESFFSDTAVSRLLHVPVRTFNIRSNRSPAIETLSMMPSRSSFNTFSAASSCRSLLRTGRSISRNRSARKTAIAL
jgi:hypothetical protein